MATFKIKKDVDGYYYWILKSDKNNHVVAMSGESYETKQNAEYAIEWTKNNAFSAAMVDAG